MEYGTRDRETTRLGRRAAWTIDVRMLEVLGVRSLEGVSPERLVWAYDQVRDYAVTEGRAGREPALMAAVFDMATNRRDAFVEDVMGTIAGRWQIPAEHGPSTLEIGLG